METTSTFNINLIGDNTGKSYNGEFTVRTILSFRQRAAADEIRRSIIGGNPEFADQNVLAGALACGQLAVRIVKAPEWWASEGLGGQDLKDDNVLIELFKLTMNAERNRMEKITEQGEEAKKKLKSKEK